MDNEIKNVIIKQKEERKKVKDWRRGKEISTQEKN